MRFAPLVADRSVSALIRQLARFHAIDTTTAKVTDIAQILPGLTPDHLLPEPDVLVEDAGLYEVVDAPTERIPVSDITPSSANAQ